MTIVSVSLNSCKEYSNEAIGKTVILSKINKLLNILLGLYGTPFCYYIHELQTVKDTILSFRPIL